jgi:hypothetical protein
MRSVERRDPGSILDGDDTASDDQAPMMYPLTVLTHRIVLEAQNERRSDYQC